MVTGEANKAKAPKVQKYPSWSTICEQQSRAANSEPFTAGHYPVMSLSSSIPQGKILQQEPSLSKVNHPFQEACLKLLNLQIKPMCRAS